MDLIVYLFNYRAHTKALNVLFCSIILCKMRACYVQVCKTEINKDKLMYMHLNVYTHRVFGVCC